MVEVTPYTSVLQYNAIFQATWMTLMWLICIKRRNGSMVDFGWPSGFTLMAIYFLCTGPGVFSHRGLVCTLYILAGFRFMYGWLFVRKHLATEDHRWQHWRDLWKNGGGLFGIKSENFNFFWFYHCQSITNAIFMSLPLYIAANNRDKVLSIWEYVGFGLWLFGFVFENIADKQLKGYVRQSFKAKKTNTPYPNVMKTGLWQYSRHPNYFGEFLLWISYVIMTFQHATQIWEIAGLILLPVVAYLYLVHFTGVFMAERVSLKKRGEEYRQYQNETNMFFPWFSTAKKAKIT